MNGAHNGKGHAPGNTAEAFANAVKDAWEDAKKNDAEPGTYEITKIFVVTSNPINEYRVEIQKV